MRMGNDFPLNTNLGGYRVLRFQFLSFIYKEFNTQSN